MSVTVIVSFAPSIVEWSLVTSCTVTSYSPGSTGSTVSSDKENVLASMIVGTVMILSGVLVSLVQKPKTEPKR